ncbi:class I SAM-dependent methyltransferase [soil metagenome]
MSTLPTNIVRRGEPSRSALRVASLRAVHQLLDEPLVLYDPIALPLLGASTAAALRDDPFALNDPMSRGLRGALVARSRCVEDELSRCVTAGVRQYLVVGAGLDTFAYRNPHRHQGLRVFEVDHPGTQRWKQQLLAEAGIGVPASLTFVPVDLERDDLAGALRRAGFHADEAACVSWMGVTMYLTVEAVADTLRTVAGFAAGSSLCFDYRVPVTMLNPVERVIDEVMAQRVAALGEPWLSAFDPTELQGQLLEVGFRTAESATPEDLNERYFARRKDGLRTGGGLRIMCASR